MRSEIITLIPSDKCDTGKAALLVAMGFPRVAPVIPELLIWMQDGNWPVAYTLQPFLASIGVPLAPYIRIILGSSDDTWKYWILLGIVQHSRELAIELKQELIRISSDPTAGEIREEIEQIASEILSAIK